MRKAFCVTLLSAGLASSAAAFELQSADLSAGGQLAEAQVYAGFGCNGGNLSPELAWTNAPTGTKSFAVTVYDPDAPTGSGWWHWVLYDIPANVAHLPRAIGKQAPLPGNAKQGRNDFGSTDFGGACPPPGSEPHRYVFTVHALGVETLAVPADASPALIGFMLSANRLGKATLLATYAR